MKVIYPVLFYEEDDNQYSIFVPDLDNVSTCAKSLEDAMHMTEELIASTILDKMEEGEKVPKSSKIVDVTFEDLENYLDIKDWKYISKFKTYVVVDLSLYADRWGKELVKKTVNIPKWINTKAEELRINFSKTLEEALLQKIYKD